jgi:hypothetical protein
MAGHSDLGLVDAALIDGARLQDAVLGVEQHHLQLLLLKGRHLDAEQVGHVFRRADRGPLLRGERGEAPAQLRHVEAE